MTKGYVRRLHLLSWLDTSSLCPGVPAQVSNNVIKVMNIQIVPGIVP